MKVGISSRCQPSTVCDSNQALLARSTRTTARVSQSQRRRAGIIKIVLPIRQRHRCRGLGLCSCLAVDLRLDRKSGGKPPHSKGLVAYVVAWAGVLSISARASLQRSQIVGYREFSPTWVE